MEVTLRRATSLDALLFYLWRNDPESRRQSPNYGPIDLNSHIDWFLDRVGASSWWVGEAPDAIVRFGGGPNGLSTYHDNCWRPVGYLRLDPVEGDPTSRWVSIVVDRAMRGCGVGPAMLQRAQLVEYDARPHLLAQIHASNARSIRAFEKAGFVRHDQDEHWLVYRKE